MSIDPKDAAAALDTVRRAETRTRTAEGYRIASGPLTVWGLVWIAANLLCEAAPERAGTIWLIADAIGIVATFLVLRRMRAGAASSRFLLAFGAMAVMVVGSMAVLRPTDGVQTAAFISLAAAFTITVTGVFAIGWRLAALGLAVSAAIAGGYLLLPDFHHLWFGLVGGGGLLLAGFWIRTV